MLAAVDIPATFYLNGADLDRHLNQGAAIARSGHKIGNDTCTHRRMMFVSSETVADGIKRTDEAIARTDSATPGESEECTQLIVPAHVSTSSLCTVTALTAGWGGVAHP